MAMDGLDELPVRLMAWDEVDFKRFRLFTLRYPEPIVSS